jgi:hypothetical protein
VARELRPLGAHKGFKLGDERRGLRLANGEALFRRQAIDLAFDGEDRVDALDRLERLRRENGKLAARGVACFGGDVGEREELASAMRPTCRFDDRAWRAAWRIEPVEAGICVGLQDAGIAGKMPLWMLACPVARIEKHGSRRIAPAEWPVVAHIGPQSPRDGPGFGQHGDRRVVAMDARAGERMRADEIVERPQDHGAAADLIGERRQAQRNAFARVTLGLAVKRLMLTILLKQDHGEQARPRQAARQHMERRRRLADLLAGAARELLAHILHDLPTPRNDLERLGHVLAELGELRRAAAGAGRRAGNDDALARQMRRKRFARRLAAQRGARSRPVVRRVGAQSDNPILGGGGFELFQLELHLIEQQSLAFAALAEKLAPHLLDRQPQMRD